VAEQSWSSRSARLLISLTGFANLFTASRAREAAWQSYSVCFPLRERFVGPNTTTNATAQIMNNASMVEVVSPPAPPEAAQKL